MKLLCFLAILVISCMPSMQQDVNVKGGADCDVWPDNDFCAGSRACQGRAILVDRVTSGLLVRRKSLANPNCSTISNGMGGFCNPKAFIDVLPDACTNVIR